MKKLVFALMAAMVMCFAFSACSEKAANNPETAAASVKESLNALDGEPEEQLMEVTKLFAEMIKDAHINSDADAKVLKAKMEAFSEKMEGIQKAVETKMEGMSDNEKLAFAGKMMQLAEEFGNIETELEKETQRLKEEADAAGVDISDLDLEDAEEEIEDAEEELEEAEAE